jgi:A/G-specific adenine glycosylase
VRDKSIPVDPALRRRFKRRLLAWFRRTGRDLPWRRTREPWPILVSEVMLQQTQVSRVLDYWPRFLARFPTPAALAAATPRQVRDAWDGLGYYRRAANLHALARTVTREHRGALPSSVEGLRALPGVGTYTAGAVASFAWERAVPAIDTNVERVLRRVFAPRLARNAAAARRLDALAQSLVPRHGADAWTTNQALMELGALTCTARVMRCGECPVRVTCRTGRSMKRLSATSDRQRAT